MQQQLLAIAPMILVFVVFYFMLLRPQRKREKERVQMLNSLKKGDKVITIGGIHGSVMDLTEKKVTLKVNDTTRLVFERSAINAKQTDDKKESD